MWLEQPLHCLLQLSDERQLGMIAGGIPYLAVVKWCELAGMTDADDIDDVANIVNRADGLIMDHFRKKPNTLSKPATSLPAPQAKVLGNSGQGRSSGRF